jgi:hypothetical protein
VEAVDEFCRQIVCATEGDYGDWMRRANLYWMELVEALGQQSRDATELLEAMRVMIQYQPDFQLIETRKRIVAMALDLRRELTGPDPWGHVPDLHDYGLEYTRRSPEWFGGAVGYSS